MPLKYYEYISDAKVDVLLPQIPFAIKQKISGELGLNLKVLTAKAKAEINTFEDRISRLETVVKYIMETESVGSLEDPEKWIYGQTEAFCGYIGKSTKIVAYSGGMVGGSYMLVGSSGHVIGAIPNDKATGFGFSFLPRLISALKGVDSFLEKNIENLEADTGSRFEGVSATRGALEEKWYLYIQNVWQRFNGPSVNIEFLARRLLTTGPEERLSLLATPLYVARID